MEKTSVTLLALTILAALALFNYAPNTSNDDMVQ